MLGRRNGATSGWNSHAAHLLSLESPSMPDVPGADNVSGESTSTTPGRYQSVVNLIRRIAAFPFAFWIINAVYAIDGFAYFGLWILLPLFLTDSIGLSDIWSSRVCGTFAACVSLFMFGIGTYSERFGVRRALFAGMLIILLGRVLLPGAAWMSWPWLAVGGALLALLLMAMGEGVLQAANYSGIKQYSSDESSALAYGLNYGLFNFGIMIVGLLSPRIRTAVDEALGANSSGDHSALTLWLAQHSKSGIEAVFWVCAAVTLLGLICCLTFTRRAEQRKLRPDDEGRIRANRMKDAREGWIARLKSGPFADVRFTVFVFILYPARTMFACQSLVLGKYIMRSFDESVQAHNESFQNFINPLIIVIGAPILNVVTRRVDMFKLMLIGTWVTVLPTFLLCLGERWELLLAYMVIFSIGEAIWLPRLYQFAGEIAPEGRVASYTAAASVPWLLAKFVTGLYAGNLVAAYCPEEGPQNPRIMWAVFGAMGLISPIGLWLAKNWLKAGLKTGYEPVAA